jgi:hypothetical protein
MKTSGGIFVTDTSKNDAINQIKKEFGRNVKIFNETPNYISYVSFYSDNDKSAFACY